MHLEATIVPRPGPNRPGVWAGFIVPDEVVTSIAEDLARTRKCLPVVVRTAGGVGGEYTYRTSLTRRPDGWEFLASLSFRDKTGTALGDTIDFEIELDAGNRTLARKLGLSPERSVALIGVTDERLVALAREHASRVSMGSADRGTDIIIFQADDAAALVGIHDLPGLLADNGALWVLWPNGGVRDVRQGDVQAAGLAAGLVDIEVAKVSERLSSVKFVRRRA